MHDLPTHFRDKLVHTCIFTSGHEIGKKFGVPSEFVLAIQGYFGLQFSLSFGHPNIFGMPIPHFGLPFGTLLFRALYVYN